MADPRFFDREGPFALGDLAEAAGAALSDPAAARRLMVDVAPLDRATGDHVSFLDNPKYAARLADTGAGAVVLRPGERERLPPGCVGLLAEAPYMAFARISRRFYPEPKPHSGIHPSAVVAAGAVIDPSAEIGANAVIGDGAQIGPRAILGPGVVVERGVRIGADCRIHANVSLAHCDIGPGSEIHAGTVVGSRGFGFASGPEGHLNLPQTGRVVIGADVEIGANCAIDRGMGPDTVIGDGCRIDNLVQIAHNVTLGRGSVVVAQSGVAGSTGIGDFCVIGAQAGMAGHLSVGAGARIAARAGVTKDVAPGETVAGFPARAHKDWLRALAAVERLAKNKKRDERQ